MTVYDWPLDLAPRTGGFNKRGMVVGGPPSLTGRTQTGSVDAGYWIATLTGFPVVTSRRIKAFRALMALLEGGAHQARVPVFDQWQAPWPVDEDGRAVMSAGPVLFSDGSAFSDGSTLYQPIISGSVSGDAALRATRITIDFLKVGEIVGSELFSIGDRLYTIRQVLEVDGTEQTFAIWPPLREAVPDGAPVNFDSPVCLMKLTGEDVGDLALDFGRFGFPDLAFVEVFGG